LPNQTQRIDRLRAEYRVRWDRYQVLSHQNATLVLLGREPTNEQLINEQRAAESVALARKELLAAMESGTTPAAP
jgi:hypothetical protein